MLANSFGADGGTLIVNTAPDPAVSATSIQERICANRFMQSVVVHGATVAVRFADNELRITRRDCKI